MADDYQDYTTGFEDEEAVILASVEGGLFRLPKMHLKVHSSVFRDMFIDCVDDGSPLKLTERTAELHAIFDCMFQETDRSFTEAWVQYTLPGVLRACHKYDMMSLARDLVDRVSSAHAGSSASLRRACKSLADELESTQKLLKWQSQAGVAPNVAFADADISYRQKIEAKIKLQQVANRAAEFERLKQLFKHKPTECPSHDKVEKTLQDIRSKIEKLRTGSTLSAEAVYNCLMLNLPRAGACDKCKCLIDAHCNLIKVLNADHPAPFKLAKL